MNQLISKSAYIDVLELFVEQGYLSKDQRLQLSDLKDPSLRSLIDQGLVPEREFAQTLSQIYKSPRVGPEQLPHNAVEGTQELASFLLEHEALPLSIKDGIAKVAMSDPSDEFTLQVLRSKLKCQVETYIALRSELLEALASAYTSVSKHSHASASQKSTTHINVVGGQDLPDDLDSDSALVRELHRLLQRAISLNASDIHFEPVDLTLRVRFRVHGMLRDVYSFNAEQRDQIVARIKLMSKLDVTERRHAQNGRFKFPSDGRVIDLRVSTLPLHDGESIVLRLLEFSLSQLSLEDLGFEASIATAMMQAISTQQGLVLVTGPTGSGKSTTLYSLLNQLNEPELKLISIEDPVELNISGVNQIQVDEEHGVSFATALKTVLRQDPDVIMIGEIRDAETAQLATQAALTGHLVLATLHTASAASAVTRLQNLGLPEYLISATVKAVLAQRLVRRSCTECAGTHDSTPDRGLCSGCAGTQYSGRTTIAELLPASAFSGNGKVSEERLSSELLDGVTLADDARRLLAQQIIDNAEVFRVLGLSV